MTRIKGKRKTKEWPCQHCGWCCEIFPMDTELVNKYRHLFQRPVKKEVKTQRFSRNDTVVFTDTKNGDCVFLKLDNKCAIYEDRPQICKSFGHSGGEIECPNVAPNGRIRSSEEAKRAKNRIVNYLRKIHQARLESGELTTMNMIYHENE